MPAAASPTNRLLEALLRTCKSVPDRIETVSFAPRHVIYRVGDRLPHVYFPVDGVLSVIVQLANGESAEALSVGNEGLIGLQVWLGQKKSTEQVVQQSRGEFRRLSSRTFSRMIEGCREAERLLKRFTIYSLQAAHQSVVCGLHHNVEQRAARWILTVADRVGSLELSLGQQLLAHMLGVQRQTVSNVANGLQRQGILRYHRAALTITNQAALKNRACECYDALNELRRELLEPLL